MKVRTHLRKQGRVVRASVLSLGVILALSAPAHAQLAAYWKADGNTLDSSGNGHTATLNGASYEAGKFGQAFDITPGTNVSAAASPAWGFGTGDFSINLWANFASYNNAGAGQLSNTLIGQDAGGGDNDKWVFFLDSNSGSGELGFHINGPDAGGSTFMEAPTAVTLDPNAWNMYTITRSGTTFSFFYNGAFLGSQTSTLTVPFSNSDLTMGQAEGIGDINGGLDDIRIYDSALNIDQIHALATPEPAPFAVVGLGLFAFGRRRRARACAG